MSKNMYKNENIFKILHQDHSYYLACPRETKAKKELVQHHHVPRIYANFNENLASLKIRNFLWSLRNRRIYKAIKSKLFKFVQENPIWLLKKLDYRYYTLFEKDNNVLVFRLAGESFPPYIVYKIFSRLYVISSFKFQMLKPNFKNSKKTYKTTYKSNRYNEWKVCYVYKKEKEVIKEVKQRKNSRLITWISEKYGS